MVLAGRISADACCNLVGERSDATSDLSSVGRKPDCNRRQPKFASLAPLIGVLAKQNSASADSNPVRDRLRNGRTSARLRSASIGIAAPEAAPLAATISTIFDRISIKIRLEFRRRRPLSVHRSYWIIICFRRWRIPTMTITVTTKRTRARHWEYHCFYHKRSLTKNSFNVLKYIYIVGHSQSTIKPSLLNLTLRPKFDRVKLDHGWSSPIISFIFIIYISTLIYLFF